MRLALVGLFRARWSAQIHDEWMRNLLAKRPDLTREQLERTRDLMDASVLDALVTGYELLIEGVALPDPDDRHVVAAAIRCGADAIITYNLKDFPDAVLQPLGIEAQHPDDFVLCQIDLGPAMVLRALREQRAALKKPAVTLDDFLVTLEAQQLVRTVARLRSEHYAELV